MMCKVNVKWGRELYKNVEIDTKESPNVFKNKLHKLTGVPPDRQRVIIRGVAVSECWSSVDLKDGLTILLMGTIENLPTEPDVKTCFIEDMSENELASVSDLPSGLANLGNTCYLNATVQCLKTVPELNNALSNFKGKTEGLNETAVATLRDLYTLMGTNKVVTPFNLVQIVHTLIPRFALKDKNDTFMQQDASECWTELVRILQHVLPAIKKNEYTTKHKRFIDQYFEGVFEIEYKCNESDEDPKKCDENFLQLNCFIAQDVKHMMYGIKSQLVETVTKHSDILGKNAEFIKSSRIKRLPAYLTVQFIRFFYKEKGSINAKILKDVKFPFEFDAYELCTPELQKRLSPMRKIFEDNENLEPDENSQEKKDLEFSFKDDLGSNNSGYYTLQAVMTHMGRSSNSGHYVAWIKHTKSWLKCDDKSVTPVPDEDIIKLSGGHGDWHCAYVLLYGPKILRLPLNKIPEILFRGKIKHYRLFYDGQHTLTRGKKYDTIEDLVADGLVTLHIEAEAGTYIQLMCDEAKYEKSPAYMTLSRFKNRTKPLLNTHQEEETVLYEKPHKFKTHNFKGLNWCEFCSNFLWGFTAQGVKCDDCGFSAHFKCSEKLPPDCCPEFKSVRSVFGVDLTAFVRSRKTTRPFVVEKCVQEIESRGLHVEGLYRISGFADEMDSLRMAFEKDGENADISANVYDNISVVAGILKQYFRLLPIPLLTYEVHPLLIKAVQLPTLKEQILMTKEALAHLPPAHYNTLKYLMAHLSKVEEHQAANKMSSFNLSTVFAPTLMPPLNSKMSGSIPDMSGEINSLNLLIHNQKLIFQSAILS